MKNQYEPRKSAADKTNNEDKTISSWSKLLSSTFVSNNKAPTKAPVVKTSSVPPMLSANSPKNRQTIEEPRKSNVSSPINRPTEEPRKSNVISPQKKESTTPNLDRLPEESNNNPPVKEEPELPLNNNNLQTPENPSSTISQNRTTNSSGLMTSIYFTIPASMLELFVPLNLDKKNERTIVFDEMVSSEQTYIRYLLILKHLFLKPLNEACKAKTLPILKQQLNVLFGNLDQIINVNIKLLKDLLSKVTEWNDQTQVGELLQQLTPDLKLYGHYLENYDQALAIYDLFRKNEIVEYWIKSRLLDPVCDGLTFDALLILPIQRVPRYRLFIQRLVSCTPQDHIDYPHLRSALDHLEEVAVEINTAADIQKERDKLFEVSDRFEVNENDPIIKPGRKFISETEILKVERKGNTSKRRLFLFNDILVVAHPPIGFRVSRYTIHKLKTMSVKDIPDDVRSRYMYRFEIISAEKSFTGVAISSEHKSEWIQLILSAIKSVQQMDQISAPQSKPAAANLQPDYEAKNCTLCNETFTFTFRRHHCRQCGRIVCQPCSKYKRELAVRQKPVRVCCVCINKPQDWRPDGKPPGLFEPEDDNDDDLFDITSFTSFYNGLTSKFVSPPKNPPEAPKEPPKLSANSAPPDPFRSERYINNNNIIPVPEEPAPPLNPDTPKEENLSPGIPEVLHKVTALAGLSSQKNNQPNTPKPLETTPLSQQNENITNTTPEQGTIEPGVLVEDSGDISLEYKVVSLIMKKYPESVNCWLDVINQIALGKLDACKFPKKDQKEM